MTKLSALLRCMILSLALMLGLAAPFVVAQAQACTSSWSNAQYKSYAQIRREVAGRLGGNARIVRVELCGSGGSAYFRVIAIVGSTREELRIGAR